MRAATPAIRECMCSVSRLLSVATATALPLTAKQSYRYAVADSDSENALLTPLSYVCNGNCVVWCFPSPCRSGTTERNVWLCNVVRSQLLSRHSVADKLKSVAALQSAWTLKLAVTFAEKSSAESQFKRKSQRSTAQRKLLPHNTTRCSCSYDTRSHRIASQSQ